jgi:hypothetical protein
MPVTSLLTLPRQPGVLLQRTEAASPLPIRLLTKQPNRRIPELPIEIYRVAAANQLIILDLSIENRTKQKFL